MNVSIFVCGDIINHMQSNQFIGPKLIDHIRKVDYAVGNFEGTMPYPNHPVNEMIQQESTLSSLKDAGFNLLLVANNHICDFGYEGFSYTLQQIQRNQFDYIGAGLTYDDAYQPLVRVINGIKFGFINLCEAQVGHFQQPDQEFGYAWMGDEDNDSRIIELRKQVDRLILLVHAGLENYRLPLPQFRHLYRHYCDLGADVVVGGHPHIAQGIEHYNGSIIFYSLGNFYFPDEKSPFAETWNKSFSIELLFNDNDTSFNIIQHTTKNNLVELSENAEELINIDELSSSLKEPFYSTELKLQNELSFKALPLKLFNEVFNGTSANDSILCKIKKIIRYIFNSKSRYKGSENRRMKLLKRLVENESYRFLTINYITDQVSENERGIK